MAVPTVVGVGTVAAGVNAITPGFPTGPLQTNDVLIGAGESVGGESFAIPTGWLQSLGSPNNITTITRLTDMWKYFQTGDVAPSWGDPGNHAVGRILAIRGAKVSTTPWNVSPVASQITTATTTATWPAVTTTVNDCLIVFLIATGRDLATTANMGALTGGLGLTNIVEQFDNWDASGTGGGIGCITATKATFGSTGNPTATMGSAANTDGMALMTLAIEPVATVAAAAPPPENTNRRLLTRMFSG